MAPEMIQNEPYDYKVDVWALGILLFEMIEGAAPFKGASQEQVIAEMRKNLFFTKNFSNTLLIKAPTIFNWLRAS